LLSARHASIATGTNPYRRAQGAFQLIALCMAGTAPLSRFTFLYPLLAAIIVLITAGTKTNVSRGGKFL
jgi:hypothetical protein